jgi:drug/metabolite transporter (DMT)-like permease
MADALIQADDANPRVLRLAIPALVVAVVAIVWGITFTVVDGAADLLPPADLVAWRFGLGTLALLLVGKRVALPVPQAFAHSRSAPCWESDSCCRPGR